MASDSLLTAARSEFHRACVTDILGFDEKRVASISDKDSVTSVLIGAGIARRLGANSRPRLSGQSAGNRFEELVGQFVEQTFSHLGHLRPGRWEVGRVSKRGRIGIAAYDQYVHLQYLDEAVRNRKELAAALGLDYQIAPDRVIVRHPEPDEVLNAHEFLVDDGSALRSRLRAGSGAGPTLHASISAKWTLRSDRAQNARTEAQNLVRNRRGKLPHVTVVTGEPLPSRLQSIALGLSDVDCVYHFALPELIAAVEERDTSLLRGQVLSKFLEQKYFLDLMIAGRRLRDISDLPLDLAI